MPAHPHWQLKQIIAIEGQQYVDRCLVIGGHTSGCIWCTFMALVMWIAINVRGIADLLHYSDNAWSYNTNPTLVFYEPYASYYLSKQVVLLMLWDKIGLPHSKHKQVFS